MNQDEHQQGASRRRFLASGALAAAGVATLSASRARTAVQSGKEDLSPAPAPPPIPAELPDDQFGVARRVIFAVSDGMSLGTLTLGDLYARRVFGSEQSNWVSLFNHPGARSGLCSTHCSDSLVTDSAAASTTWSCGKKVYRGSIGFNDQQQPEQPILLRAREAGYRTGLVTTASVTDATPAGFIANVPRRAMEREIASQILERRPNVVLGGGAKQFDQDEVATFSGNYVTNHRALGDQRQTGSQVGIFADGHLPYILDRTKDDPDLVGLTRHAVEQLDFLGGGFLLQVEAARVDHAAHNNDAASMILEQFEFDRTLGYLIDYTTGRDDTLLIITTDHGNANPGLTVYGESGQRGLQSLVNARRSFDWITRELRQRDPALGSPRIAREVIEFATGVALEPDEISQLGPGDEPRGNLFRELDSFTSRLGSLLSNHNGIGFVSKNHTSDLVQVSAVGAGAGLLSPLVDNTDLYGIVMHALGISRLAEVR